MSLEPRRTQTAKLLSLSVEHSIEVDGVKFTFYMTENALTVQTNDPLQTLTINRNELAPFYNAFKDTILSFHRHKSEDLNAEPQT